jgi:hypothetical protein
MPHNFRKKYLLVAVFPLVLIYLALAIAGLRGSTFGLRANVIVLKGAKAVPGVSKTYEAELVNRALWPIPVTRCEFVDDGSHPGSQPRSRLAYSVERGDDGGGQQWRIVVSDTAAEFCKSSPGNPEAHIVESLLWPGQKLLSGDEAAAAQEDFNLGDRARFVLFAGIVGESSASVPTPEFTIDEHPTGQPDPRAAY